MIWRRFKLKSGFTLVEMLVVMSIIGILMSITFVGIKAAREKSKVSRAKTDVGNISLAISMLYSDTRKYPGYFATPAPVYTSDNNMPRNNEIMLSHVSSGLITGNNCTGSESPQTIPDPLETYTPCFDNWNGPYYKGPDKDPWGRDYSIDPDYYGPPFMQVQIVVVSYGKSGAYDCDDIYKSLYKYDMSSLRTEDAGFLSDYSEEAEPEGCSNFKGEI